MRRVRLNTTGLKALGGLLMGLGLIGLAVGCGGSGGVDLSATTEAATRAALANWEQGVQTGNDAQALAQYGAQFQHGPHGPRQAMEEVERFCDGNRNSFQMRIQALRRQGSGVTVDADVTAQGGNPARSDRHGRMQFSLGPEGGAMRIMDQTFVGALSGEHAWMLTDHPAEGPMREQMHAWQQALQEGDEAAAEEIYQPGYQHQGQMAQDAMQEMQEFCGNQMASLEITPIEAEVTDTEGTFLCDVSVLDGQSMMDGGMMGGGMMGMMMRQHAQMQIEMAGGEHGQWHITGQHFVEPDSGPDANGS